MRHLSEYRDAATARRQLAEIARLVTRPWRIMEVCGGQTHALVRSGIDRLLPPEIEMVHGPGCPVCVTPVETIDRALAIARRPEVTFCSFGDMLRVPGTSGDLLGVKARGGDVRIVSSPLDALDLAARLPHREVVFFAIGFETTAPATAIAVQLTRARNLRNLSFLVAHVLVPPAIEAIMHAPHAAVDAFLAAGHVCTVTGWRPYPALAARHRVPIVVAGFEPVDLLEAIRRAVVQLETGRHEAENAYARVVSEAGNAAALAAIAAVFEPCDREWRGLGTIPASGWRLAPVYRELDAAERFALPPAALRDAALPSAAAPGVPLPVVPVCRSGEVLVGALKPDACPAFGRECTPRTPLGATMVSGEGACAAYWHAGRVRS